MTEIKKETHATNAWKHDIFVKKTKKERGETNNIIKKNTFLFNKNRGKIKKTTKIKKQTQHHAHTSHNHIKQRTNGAKKKINQTRTSILKQQDEKYDGTTKNKHTHKAINQEMENTHTQEKQQQQIKNKKHKRTHNKINNGKKKS